MYKWLFKKNTELTENTKEGAVQCACDGNTENCDLILQLRKCQDLEKKIKNEIETLNKDTHKLICNFINLLKKLEENGLYMGCFGNWISSESSIHIIEYTIKEYSSTDIFRITEELKTYKNKDDIICEKQRALKTVEDDIKNIKTKLGIE